MKVDLVTCLLVLLVSGHVSTGFWLQPSHSGKGYKVKTLSSDSCEGRCDKSFDPDFSCQCNSRCNQFGDCCDDYEDQCHSGDDSCVGRCNESFNHDKPCQCNSACGSHHDCCDDYDQICSGGGGVTDQDIKDFSEKIFKMQRPQSLGGVKLNTQAQTSKCGPDNAPDKLFQIDNETSVMSIVTISKLVPLFDNYKPDERDREDVTETEMAEEDEFLKAVMNTNEMRSAYELLHSKGVFKSSYNDFSAHLKKIWFGLFDRGGGKDSSCGFEHVFVGEISDGGKTVGGQHNWVRVYLLEKSGHINYKGYIDRKIYHHPANSTNVIGLTSVYDWSSAQKCIGGGLVASTPELEMAVATVCFKTREGEDCKVSFDSQIITYKTFAMHHNGYDYINTAYPEL